MDATHVCNSTTPTVPRSYGLGHANSYADAYSGEISYGNHPNQMGANLTYTDLGTGLTVLALAGGTYHSCAVVTGGKVKCWS